MNCRNDEVTASKYGGEIMEDRVERLWAAARKEEAFCKLENSYSRLEKKFEETLSQLPRRQQDLLWGFVFVFPLIA